MAWARLLSGEEGRVVRVNERFGRDPAGVPRWACVETRHGVEVAGYVLEWRDPLTREEAERC